MSWGHRQSFWAALLAVAASLACVSCSGSQAPDASATGLFPMHYSEQGLMASGTLVKATAAKPTTRSYTFDASVSREQPLALVANCTTGKIHFGPGFGPCHGGVAGATVFCAAKHVHLTVSVDQDQKRRWGFALYKTSPCSTSPNPVKESPTPAG